MAVAASNIVLKGKASFSVDPASLTPEQKKDFITRNLQVYGEGFAGCKCVRVVCSI